jgi:hypothetical protein
MTAQRLLHIGIDRRVPPAVRSTSRPHCAAIRCPRNFLNVVAAREGRREALREIADGAILDTSRRTIRLGRDRRRCVLRALQDPSAFIGTACPSGRRSGVCMSAIF